CSPIARTAWSRRRRRPHRGPSCDRHSSDRHSAASSAMTTKPPVRHVPGFTPEEVVSKIGFCEQLKGGVVMDVVNAEQARIAGDAGACAVMALERVPADIRKHGGVARASDPGMITAIQQAVSIPVMAKVRIGHFVEAQILEALEVDCIDE